jgi:hypothetical protein
MPWYSNTRFSINLMSNPLAKVKSGYTFQEGRCTEEVFREEVFRRKFQRERESSFGDIFVDPLPLVLLLLFKGILAMYPVWCLVGLGRVMTLPPSSITACPQAGIRGTCACSCASSCQVASEVDRSPITEWNILVPRAVCRSCSPRSHGELRGELARYNSRSLVDWND